MCTLVTNNLYVIVLAWSMSRTPFYVIQTLTVIFQRSHGIYTTSKDKNIDKEIITLQHIHFENLYSSCEICTVPVKDSLLNSLLVHPALQKRWCGNQIFLVLYRSVIRYHRRILQLQLWPTCAFVWNPQCSSGLLSSL